MRLHAASVAAKGRHVGATRLRGESQRLDFRAGANERVTIGTALEALSRSIHIHNEGMRLVIGRQGRHRHHHLRDRFGCSITEWRNDPRERMRIAAGRW
jgi:hypothetical protein